MLPNESHLTRIAGRVLLILLAVQVILLVISVPGQRVQGDEAAFAEFAYWQYKDGFVHSEMFRGLAGYEIQIFLYHKLFESLGAAMIHTFGYGLWPLRALSLVALLGILLLLRQYFLGFRRGRGEIPMPGRLEFLLAAVFILLAPLTFKFAKYYRPEMMQAAFGLAGFMFLRQAFQQNKTKWAVLAGAMAGTATLMHLNGVVYLIAAAGLLCWRRRWRYLVWFSLAAAIMCSLFFIDIARNPELFKQQYIEDPTFYEGERSITQTIVKVFGEHKRLFRKPEIIFTSTLFFVSLFLSFVYRRREHGDLLIYTIILMIALGGLAPGRTTPYAILLFPLFALLVAAVLAAVFRREIVLPRWGTIAVGLAGLAFVGHSLAADSINALTDKQHWVEDNRRIVRLIPPGTCVLAQMDFVLNEVENYRVLGMRVPWWRLKEWSDVPYSFERLARYADSVGAKALIIDNIERGEFEVEYPRRLETVVGPYRLVEKNGEDGLWLWLREDISYPREPAAIP